jgi:hypothetical protein
MLPTFLIIGAARSGTSTLYRYMQTHPEIYLRPSKRPEPHFFFKDSEYRKGLQYYEETWFPEDGPWKAVGEASTSYLFGENVPERIARDLPAVKLIAILRNPVERAFSNYWHTVKSGLETLDFTGAVDREAERTAALAGTPLAETKPYSYVGRGFYFAQLTRLFEHVDRSRVAIHTFDDLCGRPRDTLQALYRFLGVAPDRLPDRMNLVENRSVPDGTTLDAGVRRRLIDIYRDDVRALGQLLGRDFSGWLKE